MKIKNFKGERRRKSDLTRQKQEEVKYKFKETIQGKLMTASRMAEILYKKNGIIQSIEKVNKELISKEWHDDKCRTIQAKNQARKSG